MSIRNKRNHYNVKFLKGYGFSINVKNSKIILKDCHDPFSKPEVEEWFVRNMPHQFNEVLRETGKPYFTMIKALNDFGKENNLKSIPSIHVPDSLL